MKKFFLILCLCFSFQAFLKAGYTDEVGVAFEKFSSITYRQHRDPIVCKKKRALLWQFNTSDSRAILENIGLIKKYVQVLHISYFKPGDTLDLSGFEDLRELHFFSCDLTAMPNLSVLKNPHRLRELRFSSCNLTAMPNLSGLNNLWELHLIGNCFTSLNISGLPELRTVSFGENKCKLERVEFSNLPKFRELKVDPFISELELIIDHFELSNLPKFTKLSFLKNPEIIKFARFSNLPILEDLKIVRSNLERVEFSNLPALEDLEISRSNLERVEFSNLPALRNLSIAYNRLTQIDLLGLTTLEKVDLSHNALRNINFSGLTSLRRVNLSYNALIDINFLGLTALKEFNLFANMLTHADFSALPALQEVCVGRNCFLVNPKVPVTCELSFGEQKPFTFETILEAFFDEAKHDQMRIDWKTERKVNLSGCYADLPEYFWRALANLQDSVQKIDLSHNQDMTTLPAQIGGMALKDLNVQNCGVRVLPDFLLSGKVAQTLEVLNVAYNPIIWSENMRALKMVVFVSDDQLTERSVDILTNVNFKIVTAQIFEGP